MRRTVILLAAATALGGCEIDNRADKTEDRQLIGRGPLSNLQAGIWTDPTGCDHWLIDDGVEGYLSQRLSPSGRPVCSGTAPPAWVTGPFRRGQDIADPI